MKDCHIHTALSHDGKSPMADYFAAAPRLGVDELTFTEHYDIYEGSKVTGHTLDVDLYDREFHRLAGTAPIRCNFGIEVGLQPHITATVADMLARHDFDFVIGSSHITCKVDLAYDADFFAGCTRREAYGRYFAEMLQNVKLYDDFDVYGHIDYIVRYGGYGIPTLDYEEFREYLDPVLRTLAEKGKGLEINTSGLRYGLGAPHPNVEILKHFRQFGGEIITVGSDAHRTEDLCGGFDVARQVLEAAGFRYAAFFRERKPTFYPLSEITG